MGSRQEKVGKFLANCRKEKRLTQSKLAEMLGLTDRAISKWETGRSMPDISLLKDLSKIFGVSIEDILAGEHLSESSHKEEDHTFKKGVDHHIEFIIEKIRIILDFPTCVFMLLSAALFIAVSVWGTLATRTVIPFLIKSIVICADIILITVKLSKNKIRNVLIELNVFVVAFGYILLGSYRVHESIYVIFPLFSYSMVYAWTVYFLFQKFRHNVFKAFAGGLLSLIPLTVAFKMKYAYDFDQPLLDCYNVLSIILESFIAFTILAICRSEHKSGSSFLKKDCKKTRFVR